MRLSRAAYYRPPVPASRRDAAVIAALTDVVARYPRWGFWKCFDRLRVEGRSWNHKHVHRVYCALRLNLPPPDHAARAAPGTTAADRAAGTEPHLGARLHERDALRRPTCPVADGHRRRESGGLGDRDGPVGAQSARRPGAQRTRGRPRLPGGLADGQRAGISRAAVHRLVHRPPGGDPLHPAGQADQNAYIERFNRSYRTEVLNAHLFESIAELQALTMTWLRIYNEERPHDSLGRVPPLTFLPRPKTARESTCKVST